jgi:hypothetical protein
VNFIHSVVDRMPRPLLWGTIIHLLLGLGCLAVWRLPMDPVLGVHPALKPFKFAVSIAIFLTTMGIVLPQLSVGFAVRSTLAWLFAGTMAIEMVPIVLQSLRGTTSHFNTRGELNAWAWQMMIFAIVLAMAGMVCTAVIASIRPLLTDSGEPVEPVQTFAWRAGLWLLLLAPVSGFMMGGRLQHTVGADDGGLGLPFLNWSLLHGDLRVSHFFALHAVQVFPLLASVLVGTVKTPWLRWALVTTAGVLVGLLCICTLIQALIGQPFVKSLSANVGLPGNNEKHQSR